MGVDEGYLSRRQAQRDTEREMDKLRTMYMLLAAYVRVHGRIRVPRADVDAMGDKISMRLRRDGENAVLEWVEP